MKGVSEFNHDIIYQERCPEIGCNDHYLGETGRSISERVLDHAGIFKHSPESGHQVLNMNNYKLLGMDTKTMLENEKLMKRFL